jgi:hypothetical protein
MPSSERVPAVTMTATLRSACARRFFMVVPFRWAGPHGIVPLAADARLALWRLSGTSRWKDFTVGSQWAIGHGAAYFGRQQEGTWLGLRPREDQAHRPTACRRRFPHLMHALDSCVEWIYSGFGPAAAKPRRHL